MEQRPKGRETSDAPGVEYLLGVLKSLPWQDPPPALRNRLQLLSIERLRGERSWNGGLAGHSPAFRRG